MKNALFFLIFLLYLNSAWSQTTSYGLLSKNGQVILPLSYDIIYAYSDDLVMAVKGNSGKLLRANGTEIFPGEDMTYKRLDKYVKFSRPGRSGLLDFSGNIIFNTSYDEIEPLQGFFAYKTSEGWGVIDKINKVIIKPQYSAIEMINDSYWKCYHEKSFGIVNSDGSEITSQGWTNLVQLENGNYLLLKETLISRKFDYIFLDKNFKEIVKLYSCSLLRRSEFPFFSITTDKGCGIVDINGKIIYPIAEGNEFDWTYEGLAAYIDGTGMIFDKEMNKRCVIKGYKITGIIGENTYQIKKPKFESDTKYGLANGKGEIIVPVKYSSLELPIIVDEFRVDRNEKTEINTLSQNGKKVLELKWGKYYFFKKIVAADGNKDGKNFCGIYDRQTMKPLTDPGCEWKFVDDDKYIQYKNSLYDLDFNKLIDQLPETDFISNDVIVYHKKVDGIKKYGVMDMNGKDIFQPIYDWCTKFTNGIGYLTLKKMDYKVNNKGEILSSKKWENLAVADEKEDGADVFKEGNKLGVKLPNGSVIVPAEYSKIVFKKNYYIVEKTYEAPAATRKSSKHFCYSAVTETRASDYSASDVSRMFLFVDIDVIGSFSDAQIMKFGKNIVSDYLDNYVIVDEILDDELDCYGCLQYIEKRNVKFDYYEIFDGTLKE